MIDESKTRERHRLTGIEITERNRSTCIADKITDR